MRSGGRWLGVLGWVLCAGCIIPVPLPGLHPQSPRGTIEEEALVFLKTGSTTMEEVLLQLGAPENYYSEPTVFEYRWTTIVRAVYVVPPTVLGTSCVWHKLRIMFDDAGRVGEQEMTRFPSSHFGPGQVPC